MGLDSLQHGHLTVSLWGTRPGSDKPPQGAAHIPTQPSRRHADTCSGGPRPHQGQCWLLPLSSNVSMGRGAH